MKKVIKAILIDVVNKEVKEVDIEQHEGNYIQDIYKHLNCTTITSTSNEVFGGIAHCLFVDDEGLLKEPIGAFSIYIDKPRPYQSQVLSGNGILVGINNEGETISHILDLNIIKNIVKWEDVNSLPEPTMRVYSN